MKKSILLFAALFMVLVGYSQKKYPTETETHIFWQPNRKLTAEDFQRDPMTASQESIEECDSLNYCVVGGFGLFRAIDISKGKYNPGRYHEILYMAPAFEKPLSCILKPDSLGIEIQQILFDIEELKARTIRYRMDHLSEIFGIEPIDNPYTMFFSTIFDECDDFYGYLKAKFLHDVVYHEGESFEEWRSTVDQYLEQLKDYATTAEDCYRFVKGKPLKKNMVEPKYLAPSYYKKSE